MKRSVLARVTAAATAVGIAASGSLLLTPATASAAVGDGVQLSSKVSGNTVDYTIVDIPNISQISPITIPGQCNTALVNVPKAIPVAGPAIVDTISDKPLDYLQLLQQLVASGAVQGGPNIQVASRNQITGSFTNVPAGLYAIATICNVNPIGFEFDPKLFGSQVVLVNGITTGSAFDTGSLSGSSTGSGGSSGSATGSGASA